MALIRECFKCGREKIIDTCCSEGLMICFECFDNRDGLNHKPNCPVSIRRRIERNTALAEIHHQIETRVAIIDKHRKIIEALMFLLRQSDPCLVCQGLNYATCLECNQTGYNSKPSEEALSEKMPPPTY